MKTGIYKCVCILFLAIAFMGCGKKDNGNNSPNPTPTPEPNPFPATVFVKGADASWITQMEASGRKFYNATNTEVDGLALLKSLGCNAIRLRVWVNPVGGWNGKADVLAKALRIKNLGMRLMIDFHYSDSWADPGQQTKPAAWSSLNIDGLVASVTTHTTEIMTMLKNNNVLPEWVQVGNETNDGMLWPEGKASTSMINFARLITAGYDAVKAISPYTKVIVHLSNGNDNALFRWLFDGLKSNGGKWDVIGMSLYPSVSNWNTMNNQCFLNMNDMVARYNCEVMVVEVGMPWDAPSDAKAFLLDIISKTKQVNNNKGLGVIYWEPESYANWQGYTKGAFDNTGKPTVALDAFN
jgi:arabinogalactan endo-1,4-beta-galactosidase